MCYIPFVPVRPLLAFLLLLSFGCSDAQRETEAATPVSSSPTAAVKVESIELSRTACYGSCPVYTVSVDASGEVHFEGEQYVAAEGERSSQLDAATIAALGEEILAAGFLEISQEQVDECPQMATDHPSAILTIRVDGQEHQIRHYHGCRGLDIYETLSALEDRVDEVLNTASWIKGS